MGTMILRAVVGMALSWAFAQLSGIVNQYAAVLAPSDPSNLTVDNPALFSVGDRIMVYQAKGATINTSNSSSYGDITALGGAGLFEFNTIVGISGNTLTLQCGLTRPFNLSTPSTARIQVIKVSYHPGDVTITGLVTAPPWDGQKGGVVVIETEGTLTFAANIDVSGRGFRGGLRSLNGGSSSACDPSTFHGDANDQAGRKGEGISEWLSTNHYAYRGKIANGGGGGNNHNTGGGGGANYGTGGQGGWTTCGSRGLCPGWNVSNSGTGIGGAALSTYLSSTNLRLFMGGGGGGGHHNNEQGGNGGNGGGVVILRAASINGAGHQIIVSGTQGVQNLGDGCNQWGVSFAGNDGAGGGGAGGSVAIFCSAFSGNLTIDARGADGQNCSSHLCACFPDHGPGGGGGGGYAAFSQANLPPGISLLLSGGQNGIELTPLNENQYGCTNTGNCISDVPSRYHRGASSGGAGGVIYSASFTPYNSCPLSNTILRRWEVTSLPTGELRHTWEIKSQEPIRSLSLRLRDRQTNAQYAYTLPADYEGSYGHSLPPGLYEGLLTAQTASGNAINLGTKLIPHDLPFIWKADQLYLTSRQGENFFLYDVSGRLLVAGVTPQVVSFTGLAPGMYMLQIGTQMHRLYYWR
ncbi:MAG: hypothetical protein NZZ60_08305 [Bacteroidia bacterium]|nr:hypothetical protein [Bacteroidia bacterium]MDW8416118.1 hypothetical protein [Bacteroidia bacterium]